MGDYNQFKSWNSFKNFEYSVKRQGRYIRTNESEEFLGSLLGSAKKRKRDIKKGEVYWRAQVGVVCETQIQDGIEYEIDAPFKEERMKPIAQIASEGRANPRGIPYLYLAREEQTALAEVRPFKGAGISLARLIVDKPLSIIDCRVDGKFKGDQFIYLEEPSHDERELSVWTHIDHAFSKPVSPDDASLDYIPTQIIAELFNQHGYDGVLYRSSLRNGANLVLFDLNSASVHDISVRECTQLSVTCKETHSPTRKGMRYKQNKN